MRSYRYLAPAAEELTKASQFYESKSAGLGTDFLDAVQQAVDVLRQQPLIGQEVGAGLRKALTHTFPFTLIYSPEEKEILIVAVAHQRRKPGYWRGRIGR